MLKSVFHKTLYEKRWFILSWSIGIIAMTILTMVFYPYFKDAGFDELINSLPKSFEGLLGEASNYRTVSGYVGEQIFAMRLPMLILIMTITLFTAVGVGDENRGNLETLLAQPVSRGTVYWHKFWAASLITAIACVAIFVAVCISFIPIKDTMSLSRLAEATIACWLLGVAVGAFTYAIGAISGRRSLTIGLASGITFLSFLISSMAPAVEGLKQVQKVSIFYYYNVPTVAQHGLQLRNTLVLIGITLLFAVLGLVVFQRRDLVRD